MYAALQTALLETAHSTVDGPVSGCVQKIVAAELRGELAVTPRLRMAAKIVLAMQPAHATHKPVQVRLVCMKEL